MCERERERKGKCVFACVSVSGREGKGEGGQPAVLWQSCPQQVRRWFLIDCGLKLCNNDHVCSAATAAAHGKFLSMILSLHFKFFFCCCQITRRFS